MKYIKSLYIWIFALFAFPVGISAQKVTFSAEAPQTVVAGEAFRVQFTVNSDDVSKLQTSDFDNFQVLNGPAKYSSQEVRSINGKFSQSVSTTYTYVLMAEKAGTFSIAPASIVVDGKKYKSNSLSIKVIPAENKQGQNQGSMREGSGVTQNISSEHLFIRPIVSKTKVREQEMVLLTYKVYYKVDLVNITDVKMPDFNGLMTHDIEVKKPQDIESYNGQNYYTSILKQMLISPQRAGNITINPMKCTAIVRTRQTVRDPRSFFGSYTMSQDVKKPLSTGTVTLNVSALPEPKPADFSGAVGNLTLSSSISETELKANNSLTLKIVIKGTGNLKLIKTPKVDFPIDFEQYDPKINNNFSITQSGFSGSKSIEYLSIPRHNGQYEIPSVSLTYYDLSSSSYKTLKTDSYKINVLKGDGNNESTQVYSGVNKENVAQIATDIRYIKTGDLKIKNNQKLFTGSLAFWLLIIIPLVISIFLGLIFSKKAKENANIALMKNKKANKIARKRLKSAEKYMKDDNKGLFYDELLSAIWLYLSDKLNIPLASLNKDNAGEEMQKHNIDEELVRDTMNIIQEAELQRYANVSDNFQAREKIYDNAANVIGKLESVIKR